MILVGAARLGRGVSVHQAPTGAAVLRTSGPYRYVRHPIYTGVLLLAGGISATAGSLTSIAVFAGLVGLLSVKSRFEERLLIERFAGYSAYAATTPRFMPRLGGHLGGSRTR